MTGPGPAGGAAAPERHVDLHSHSTASDGALPPAAVVEAAREAGLEDAVRPLVELRLADLDAASSTDDAASGKKEAAK